MTPGLGIERVLKPLVLLTLPNRGVCMQGHNNNNENNSNLSGLRAGLIAGSDEPPSDIQLIELVKSGERAAFSELVRRHQKALLRLTMRFLRDLESAEDVVQESFLKAYQKLHLFEGRSAFKSWLFQIAINTAKNKLRARKQDVVSIDNISLAVNADADTVIEGRDLKIVLKQAIDQLPERQKMALVLRIYEDLSFKEVAEIMKCPYDTAKANYRHALMKLRHKMADGQINMHLTQSETFFLGRMSYLKGVEV